jgi:hypothetical protein
VAEETEKGLDEEESVAKAYRLGSSADQEMTKG